MTQGDTMKVKFSAELDKADIDQAFQDFLLKNNVQVPAGHQAVFEHTLTKVEVLFVPEGDAITTGIRRAGRVSTRAKDTGVLPQITETAAQQLVDQAAASPELRTALPLPEEEPTPEELGQPQDDEPAPRDEEPAVLEQPPSTPASTPAVSAGSLFAKPGNLIESPAQDPAPEPAQAPAQAPSAVQAPKPLFQIGG